MGLFIILGRYFRIKSSDIDGLKGTTISPFVYAVFPSHDVYMEVAMCLRLIGMAEYVETALYVSDAIL